MPPEWSNCLPAAQAAAGQHAQRGLQLAADELPSASKAATAIQKHFRGHVARKE